MGKAPRLPWNALLTLMIGDVAGGEPITPEGYTPRYFVDNKAGLP